jgi:hypothetical protein
MEHQNERRDVLKYLLSLLAFGVTSILTFKKEEGFKIGKMRINSLGTSKAFGECGIGVGCAGGGGQCGIGVGCAGGGGQCGIGVGCAGGGGQCGIGVGCAGGGGQCGIGVGCGGS